MRHPLSGIPVSKSCEVPACFTRIISRGKNLHMIIKFLQGTQSGLHCFFPLLVCSHAESLAEPNFLKRGLSINLRNNVA